jgi:CRISPR/Cas system-associated exonuclease Cas4 (RecB family)
MSALENVFSWSKSRAEEFGECQRKYFYNRYASWGGWDLSAPKEARLAYILKNLKNRWAWKGETVHHSVETVLKSMRAGKFLSADEAIAELTRVMRRDFLSSKSKKYMEDPKRNLGLFEHEYVKPVSDAVWKAVHDEAAACLKNFISSSFYQELASDDKKNWLVIEDLEEFDFNPSTNAQGPAAKIFVKLDFARKKEGVVEIFDWKTGKEESGATIQIGAYAIYAMKKWDIPLSQIRAYLVYLSSPEPRPQEQPLTEALIEDARNTISWSIGQMRTLLLDPKRNIPKPREFFRFTENEKLCSYCNFYKICEKYAHNP